MVDTTLFIYRVGQSLEKLQVDLPEDPGYDRLRTLLTPLLNGGNLEHVSVLFEGRRADMFVDEMSALSGLPRNETATRIYRNNWLTQHPEVDPESISAVFGPAVLISRIVWR